MGEAKREINAVKERIRDMEAEQAAKRRQAAISIQRRFRGRQARKEVELLQRQAALKREQILLKKKLNSIEAKHKMRHQAACKIQVAFRSRMARRTPFGEAIQQSQVRSLES